MKTPPQEFVSQVVRPPDFDAFWDDLLARSARLPLNVSVEPLPLPSTPEAEVFEVHYDSIDGVRIAAWYTLPRQRPEPLPALLFVPGYISDPPLVKGWAKEGYALLSVAPRGKLRSNRQFNPGYPGLLTHNIVDRNTYGYRGFYIDAVRAIDVLLSQPEIDSARIGVMGSSQGGGLTIVTSALHPAVRAASSGAPYLCGFMDAIELTSTNPYHEIREYLRLHPERREAVRGTLAYFDGINFAPRIRCPIIVNVGLQDPTCPAETGFALFNAIASSDKKLYPYDGHGHEAGAAHHAAVIREFFAAHLTSIRPTTGGEIHRPLATLARDAEDRRGPQRKAETGRDGEHVLHPSHSAALCDSSASLAKRAVNPSQDPAVVEQYWERVEAELAALPMAVEEEPLPLRSTDFADCYAVRLTSIGPYRIFAYLSIPKGEGPYPALYQVPRLGSVVEVLQQGEPHARRGRFVTLSLAFRGQRNADQPYAAAFPGLLTDGIEDPETYVFRGIVADVLRGLDYLLTRPEIDRSRIVALGSNDLALLLAGMRPQVTHLVTSLGPFYDVRAGAEHHPEEIGDWLRAYPEQTERVTDTLAYFDPVRVASRIRATCLLQGGPEDSVHGPEGLRPLTEAIAGPVEIHVTQRSHYLDGKFREDWLTRQLGFPRPIYPEAWPVAPTPDRIQLP